MPQSINGYSYGRLTITSTGDVPGTQTVDLPITNFGGGLEETTIFRSVNHEVINLDVSNPVITQLQDPVGFELIWTFNYVDWITGTDLYNKFYRVIQAWQYGSTMRLQPRVDVARDFEVILVNETLTMKLRKAVQNNAYHRGVLFTFKTKTTINDLKWILTPLATDPVVIAAVNEYNYNS